MEPETEIRPFRTFSHMLVTYSVITTVMFYIIDRMILHKKPVPVMLATVSGLITGGIVSIIFILFSTKLRQQLGTRANRVAFMLGSTVGFTIGTILADAVL